MPIKGIGTVSATPPMAMGASGDQSGTTWSAIANGTITITSGDAASAALAQTISRDTSGANAGALVQQFDEAKRQDIAQGFQAAQTLAAETTAFLSSQASKADKWTREHPNEDPKSNPYAIWGAGGAGRLVLTAINGAAGSDVAGSLTSLVQGAAVNVLQGLATSKVKDIADKLRSEKARAALQGRVGCAGSAAGGSGDRASGAMGAAASVVLNNLLASIDQKASETISVDAQGAVVRTYTQQEQQARSNLVGALVAAIAQTAGLDTQAATLSAQVETQNNASKNVSSPGGTVKICTVGDNACAGAHPLNTWKHGTKAEQERWNAFAELYPGASDEQIIAAMDRFYDAARAKIADPKAPTLTEAQAIAQVKQDDVAGQRQADAWLCNGNTPFLCAVQSVNAFNQTPTGVRLVGGMQLVGGGLEALGGVATIAAGAASCPESLGLGCGGVVLGVASIGMGGDQAVSGLRALWSGTPVGTLGGYGLSAASGMSRAEAEAWYGQANMVVGFASAGFANAAELSALANVRNGYVYSVAAKGVPTDGLAFELKYLDRHIEGAAQANRMLRKGEAVHVFETKTAAGDVAQAIIERGEYTGSRGGFDRYGLQFDAPIGYRIAPEGSRIPLSYGQLKVRPDGMYHVIPRTGPGQ